MVYFIHSFIHQWHHSLLFDPGLFFSFVISFTQTAGLPGRVISQSECHYLHTRKHKHRKNAQKDTHALSEIRTHDPSEDSSRLRPRGRAIVQVVSCWLPIAVVQVPACVCSCGICGGQSDAGAGFLRVLRFPLPIFIPANGTIIRYNSH
jgi:hypothetical protein